MHRQPTQTTAVGVGCELESQTIDGSDIVTQIYMTCVHDKLCTLGPLQSGWLSFCADDTDDWLCRHDHSCIQPNNVCRSGAPDIRGSTVGSASQGYVVYTPPSLGLHTRYCNYPLSRALLPCLCPTVTVVISRTIKKLLYCIRQLYTSYSTYSPSKLDQYILYKS